MCVCVRACVHVRACMCVRACVWACVRACVRVGVCVCARARARGYMRVLNIIHVFAGVCQWKKPGQASGGQNVRVGFLRISFIFIVTLNVPS